MSGRPRVTMYRAGKKSDRDGLLRWRVKGGNGEPISKCSEGYHREENRVQSIRLTYEATLDWLKINDPGYFQPADRTGSTNNANALGDETC